MISLRVYQLSKLAKVFFSTFLEFLYVYQRVVLGDPQKAWQHDAFLTKPHKILTKAMKKCFRDPIILKFAIDPLSYMKFCMLSFKCKIALIHFLLTLQNPILAIKPRKIYRNFLQEIFLTGSFFTTSIIFEAGFTFSENGIIDIVGFRYCKRKNATKYKLGNWCCKR